MYEQRHQIAQYMSVRGRTTRYRPPTGIPGGERLQQVELLVNAVWQVSRSLGLDPGRHPTLVFTGAPASPPSAILGAAATLLVETLATFNMTGLADVATNAVMKIATHPTNAGDPNLTHLIDETYSEDEDKDQILQG